MGYGAVDSLGSTRCYPLSNYPATAHLERLQLHKCLPVSWLCRAHRQVSLRQARRAGEAPRACTWSTPEVPPGCTPDNPVCIRCTPVYFRCTQREGPENRAVRSETNPKSAGLPKAYPASPTPSSWTTACLLRYYHGTATVVLP